MARPRALPPGIRPRGRGYVYDWRDASGKTFSRKAGETIADERAGGELGVDARLERQLLAAQVADPPRLPLGASLGPAPLFGATPLPKITPAMVREWFAAAHVPGRRDNTLRQHVAVLKSILKSARADGHIAFLPTDVLRVPRQVRHAVTRRGRGDRVGQPAPTTSRVASISCLSLVSASCTTRRSTDHSRGDLDRARFA